MKSIHCDLEMHDKCNKETVLDCACRHHNFDPITQVDVGGACFGFSFREDGQVVLLIEDDGFWHPKASFDPAWLGDLCHTAKQAAGRFSSQKPGEAKTKEGPQREMTRGGVGGIIFVGLLTIVFITLKLTGVIHWSWVWVLSPLWILPATLATIVVIVLPIAVFTMLAALLFARWHKRKEEREADGEEGS